MIDTDRMFEESARLIADAASNPVPVTAGMSRWFEYCESVAPKKNALWSRMRRLDFDADTCRLSDWLSRVLAAEPPPEAINGLWFGLFNPCDDDGEASCQVYLGGSTGFDPQSESDEWVCDLSYFPDGRYANSKILPEIYRHVDPIEEDDIGCLGEAFLCHGFLALVVSNWCHGPMKAQLLGNAKQRAVALGHDSGDFYRMAVLRAG